MGLFKDIKEEWTWAGIKKSLKEEWIDLLAIAITGGFTPSILQWLGWPNNFWTFFIVFFVIAIVVGIVIGFAMRLIKKIKK